MNGKISDAAIKKRMSIRNAERATVKENSTRKGHLIAFGVIVTLVLCGLFVRVLYLKQVYGDEYERYAVEQELKNQESILSPIRGTIKDRNNQLLVVSHSVDNIILDARNLAKEKGEVQEKTLQNINKHLGIPMTTLEKYLSRDADGNLVHDSMYIVIARGVSKKVSRELLESGVKCVHTEEDSQRSYVHDNLAAQVLGFVRGAGSWGLENKYNTELSGTPGRSFNTIEGLGSVSNQIPAQDGYTLVTTIDLNIQQIAEKAAMEGAAEYEAQNTSVIVMNPKTGEILAMADNLGFNPNEPSNIEAFTDMRLKSEMAEMNDEELLNALYKVWGNYNISDSLEIGSVFKPIVVAAALEENLISESSTYYCTGHKVVHDRDIQCWIYQYPARQHGTVDLVSGLAQSCNVMLMDIGAELGRDLFYKYQRDFGFGEKTGIDLPGEMDALALLHTKSGLNPVEIATGSIGQGFNATPIQAINAFAAIINGGNLMRPYIVSQILDSDGNLIKETTPEIQRRVISESTSYFMRNALRSTVDSETGTGRKAKIEGYSIGGKTGTAEQTRGENKEYAQLFMAFLPAENPEIIALAIINKPRDYQEGSTSAAPMLKNVLLDIIKYRGMQPTASEYDSTVSILEGNEITLENYIGKGTAEASRLINKTGMNYELIGNGDTVESQQPPAGSKVSRDSMVWLYLKSENPEVSLVMIPDVKGVEAGLAQEILTAAGFNCVLDYDYTESVIDAEEEEPLKYVSQIYPSPGIKVAPGTEIKLKLKQSESN